MNSIAEVGLNTGNEDIKKSFSARTGIRFNPQSSLMISFNESVSSNINGYKLIVIKSTLPITAVNIMKKHYKKVFNEYHKNGTTTLVHSYAMSGTPLKEHIFSKNYEDHKTKLNEYRKK